MPVFVAVNAAAWVPAALFALAWALVVVVTVTPVRGTLRDELGRRPAPAFAVGALTGWTRFRSRAAAGAAADLDVADLPGVLAGVEIHDGPPQGPAGRPGSRSCRTTPPAPGPSPQPWSTRASG